MDVVAGSDGAAAQHDRHDPGLPLDVPCGVARKNGGEKPVVKVLDLHARIAKAGEAHHGRIANVKQRADR